MLVCEASLHDAQHAEVQKTTKTLFIKKIVRKQKYVHYFMYTTIYKDKIEKGRNYSYNQLSVIINTIIIINNLFT